MSSPLESLAPHNTLALLVHSPSLSIDEFGPLPVHQPASVADLGELVREAVATGQGVYPVGGRTALGVGLPPIKPGFALETTAIAEVIDYPARDMTITVQAGITLAKVQELLATEHQWLPIDVPSPERATLGGTVALNQSGPHRFGWGTLRDYVIGISFVTDEGVEVKAGGRVVKNVAGYDLMKLQIGALGTLGVLTQLTLKVKPKPESAAALAFGCDASNLDAMLNLLHASKARPTIVEVLSRRAAGVNPLFNTNSNALTTAEYVIAIGFEEKAITVEWQRQTLLDEMKAAGVRDVTPIAEPAALWSSITALQTRPESRFIWKVSVPPSEVASFICGLPDGLVHAHALNGIVWVHDFESLATKHHATLFRCPRELKASKALCGTHTPAWELMKHVKRTLDPNNVFNPGRLFGDM